MENIIPSLDEDLNNMIAKAKNYPSLKEDLIAFKKKLNEEIFRHALAILVFFLFIGLFKTCEKVWENRVKLIISISIVTFFVLYVIIRTINS